jgi:hypothetical protein
MKSWVWMRLDAEYTGYVTANITKTVTVVETTQLNGTRVSDATATSTMAPSAEGPIWNTVLTITPETGDPVVL